MNDRPPTAREWKTAWRTNRGKISTILNWCWRQSFYPLIVEMWIEKVLPVKLRDNDELIGYVQQICIFEDTTKGATVLEQFIEQAPLTKTERDYYTKWLKKQVYGLFQVKNIFYNQGVRLKDLFDNKYYWVADRSLSKIARPDMIIVSRLVPHLANIWILNGNGHTFPPETQKIIEQSVKKSITRAKQSDLESILISKQYQNFQT